MLHALRGSGLSQVIANSEHGKNKMLPNYKKTHPPSWLEHSKWFQKLYALRRVLHHSSGAWFSDTDKFLISLITYGALNSDDGFFVDVGCFHPVKMNTTYCLYRRGWCGINVDVDKVKIEAFKIKRSRDISIACGVSEQEGIIEYWKCGFWSPYNSFEETEKARREMWKKTKAKTDTLTNIIDQTPYKNRPIDFLSVDVESHELSVLRSLDFLRYQPRVICVETWDMTLRDVMSSELYCFLVSEGYLLVNWVNLNLIFLHQGVPIKRLPGDREPNPD